MVGVLILLVLSALRFNQGPYRGSRKEPDAFIQPVPLTVPTVVFESGWTESKERLADDLNLWLVGGSGDVKAAIILNWSKVGSTNTVEGDVECYTLDQSGMPVCSRRYVVFPAPPAPQAAAQTFNLTRRTLFGRAIATGANPNDVFPLRLNQLRDVARRRLAEMGLVPAL